MAADAPGGLHCHSPGVFDGLHCQPVAGVGCLGLQQPAGKYPGADLPAVFYPLAAGEPGRDHTGRLAAVLVVGRRAAAL